VSRSPARNSARYRRVAKRFDAALQFQRAGNLLEAERGFTKVVDSDPAHAPALHSLALLLHRRGERDEAIDLMRRAAQGHDVDATLFNNLANMLRESGRTNDAIAAYRQALVHDRANLNAQFNLARTLLDSGEGSAARASFEQLLRAVPDDPAALNGLGFALLAQGDGRAAVTQFQRLVDIVPDDAGAHLNLCGALIDADCAPVALEAAQQALIRFVDDLPLLALQAGAQTILGLHGQAEQSFRRSLAINRGDPQVYIGLARSLIEQHRGAQALEICEDLIDRFPQLADGFACKGIVLKHLGRTNEAVSALERAVAIEPSFAESWNNLGMMAMDLGDMTRAQESFARALSLQPDSAQALFNVIRTRRNTDEHRAQLEHIERLAEQSSRAVEDRVSLRFALGKAFDDLRESERAFAHYAQGNEMRARSAAFDPVSFRRWSQALHETFTEKFFAHCRGFGSNSERPVFIVGMPRSGTSLVEQILASHPQVFGGDELNHIIDFSESLHSRVDSARAYPHAAAQLRPEHASGLAKEYLAALERLDSQAALVTDKMPANFFHLGLIAAILPNARVIHCTRDPMDSCFSNYIQLFGDLHHYSYDLQHVAVFYNEYRRIMTHWGKVLPLRMHTVNYEAVVDNPRLQTEVMLDFLDLPFDDACIEFHRTERVVTTASHWQVRQPIYRTSRQRWRRYAEHLRELAVAIGYDIDVPDAEH
jgi:tetratricopeptide (TPR) repeat protein